MFAVAALVALLASPSLMVVPLTTASAARPAFQLMLPFPPEATAIDPAGVIV